MKKLKKIKKDRGMLMDMKEFVNTLIKDGWFLSRWTGDFRFEMNKDLSPFTVEIYSRAGGLSEVCIYKGAVSEDNVTTRTYIQNLKIRDGKIIGLRTVEYDIFSENVV